VKTHPRPVFWNACVSYATARGDTACTGRGCDRVPLHARDSHSTGIEPDLIAIGKVANGYALSAPRKKRDHMGAADFGIRARLSVSTTNGAERSALAACLATIDYHQHDVIGRLRT